MKRTIATIAALASCLALNASAQTSAAADAATPAASAPAGPTKIAVIVFQQAVAQTNDFQRRYADLQKKFDPKRQQIQTLNTEIASLQKELQAQSATLSDAQRATKAKQLDDKQKELKRTGEDAQGDFQQDMQQTFATVAGKVAETVDSYAKEHGYTLVLDGGNQQVPVVLYASQSTDITKAVIDAYNTKSGIPAPERPAGASAPSAPVPQGTTPRPSTTHKAPAAH
ncbi:OmpH family outer membrane protein [Occallatibacter savannae]|uniref:OmpH family outer membrane protein n=1 Tax=Occallatibacter savannae TaxID=1002691 RepID=UPI0013A576C0|nr:OmpH family outer membrane protein [Occallatibacter savannae]